MHRGHKILPLPPQWEMYFYRLIVAAFCQGPHHFGPRHRLCALWRLCIWGLCSPGFSVNTEVHFYTLAKLVVSITYSVLFVIQQIMKILMNSNLLSKVRNPSTFSVLDNILCNHTEETLPTWNQTEAHTLHGPVGGAVHPCRPTTSNYGFIKVSQA